MKYNNYSKNNHCKCEKLISNNAKFCIKCANTNKWRDKDYAKNTIARLRKTASKKGKDNPNYIDGRTLQPKYCIDCAKKLSSYTAQRCLSCSQSAKPRTKSWRKKIGVMSKRRWKLNTFRKKNITEFITHHKYGKESVDTIDIKRKLHKTLHTNSYWYILEKYGKKGIDKYTEWFFKKIKEQKV